MAKKKNTGSNFETYRTNISLRPVVNNSTNSDPLTNQIKDIDKIINLNIKIKQLENSGMKDMADDIREANGISKSQKEDKKESENYKMLMTLWINEADESKKDQIQKLMMMENMKGGNSDSANQMMFMAMMSPKQNENKKSEVENLLMQSVLNSLTNQMGKDPIESLVKYQEMMGKLNTGQGELASFLDSLEKGKSMGLVSESQPTIEDRKLSLEEKKIDNEMELKKIENDRDAGSKAETITALSSIASSFLQSNNNKVQPEKPQPTEEPKQEQIDGTCATCNNKITFTHPEESRDITCPSCDEKYHWDSEKQEMQFNKKPDESNSPL